MKVAQLCLSLCNPMGCIVHGILQARILEWVTRKRKREDRQRDGTWQELEPYENTEMAQGREKEPKGVQLQSPRDEEDQWGGSRSRSQAVLEEPGCRTSYWR